MSANVYAADAILPPPEAVKCASCHGQMGEGKSAPKIAGISHDQFAAALHDFKSGKKDGATMAFVAKGLNDQAIEALAQYYSNM